MKRSKKWQAVLIVIPALGVIGVPAGRGDEEKKNGEPTAEETDDKKKKDKKKEPKKKTYGIKDTPEVDDMEYTVNDIETTNTVGDEHLNQKTQEIHLIASVIVRNNGDGTLSVLDSFFKPKKKDKTYDTDSTVIMYLGGESIFVKEISLGASLKRKIVPDITKAMIDDKSLRLQVQAGARDTERGLTNLHQTDIGSGKKNYCICGGFSLPHWLFGWFFFMGCGTIKVYSGDRCYVIGTMECKWNPCPHARGPYGLL